MIDESDLEAERAALLKIGFTCRVLRFGTTSLARAQRRYDRFGPACDRR